MSQISKEAVAGVWPVDYGEAHITRAFPSIAAGRLGRLLGSLYSMPLPIGLLIHLATLPLPVLLAIGGFFLGKFRRYELTSARILERRGLGAGTTRQVELAELEDVRSVVRPGQAYYRAADLELIVAGKVAMTLEGVWNAEAFRQNILRARDALVQVTACRKAIELAAAAS